MPKILLVDDDIAEISAVKRVIARAGHQVVLATGSSDALAVIAQFPPALLLVSATCEGGEALRRCAGADEFRGVPVVVLGETRNAPGAAPQLPRPLDPEQLAASLAGALAASAQAAPVGSAAGGSSRKAAADALRARAEELRRGAASGRVEAPRAQTEPAPPAARSAPAVAVTSTASPDPDDPGLEAILRRAEEAERAHAARANGHPAQARGGDVARPPAERSRAGSDQRARSARADIHADIEGELARLELQLAEERRSARDEAGRVASERAAAAMRGQEEDARRREVEDARRHEEEGRRRAEDEAKRRAAEEEQLRAAIESARAEMEVLRRRSEEESRRRAVAEAEVARLAREAELRTAAPPAQPTPEAPAIRPPLPDPDPAEEAARRRVAALRERPARPSPQASPQAVELAAPTLDPDPATAPAAPTRPPPAELRAGTLADLPAPRLFAMAARAAVSGRMDFEGQTSRSIYLEDGSVVGATSSDPGERVEELALRLGLVTREQHRQVSTGAAPLATRRAALTLLERGFLKPTELTGLVRRRTEEVVFGVFADGDARFRWSAAEVPADERTSLERTTLALSVEGVRRRWLAPQVDAVLGGAGTLLTPAAAGPTAAELSLAAEERRAVALADGLRTLDEIEAASPLDPLSTRQTLAALVLVGALAVRTFHGGRPAAAATAAIDLARVYEKLDQVRRADYFTVLGVGRLCTPHEVRDAFERLRAEFEPGRFHGLREEGLEGHLDEIRGVVADARDVLADERLRDEYLRGLGE